MNVMKTIVESYYNCGFAICNNTSSADESKLNIGYSTIEEIPEEIDAKKHPKIAQRIIEAQEIIAKAKSKKAKNGALKSKTVNPTKMPIHNIKRTEKTRDESR